MSKSPDMGPAAPEPSKDQPKTLESVWNPDTSIVSDEYENNSLVMEAEKIVFDVFRSWVKESGVHESRVDDIVNRPTEVPKSLLLGNERNRVLRTANIALAEYSAE